MVTGIIGRKVGMTQMFDADGTVHPATVIKAGPCVVVQAKTAQTDGYEAVQLGLVEETPAKANKPTAGHFKKASVPPTRVRREVELAAGAEPPKAGDQVLVSIFADGERVDVVGTGRGKGFQGVVKRHHSRAARRRTVDVPPRARIDWRIVVSVARRQGHAHGRPDGRRARHDAQPEGAARRSGEQPADRRGRHSGRADRLRDHPQGGHGRRRSRWRRSRSRRRARSNGELARVSSESGRQLGSAQ